jgi:hypothetical protein
VGCPEKRAVQKTDCGVFILIPRGFQDIVIIVYEQTFNGLLHNRVRRTSHDTHARCY